MEGGGGGMGLENQNFFIVVPGHHRFLLPPRPDVEFPSLDEQDNKWKS